MIESEALQEFKTICEADLNHPCTDAEAIEMAERVIRYFRTLED